MKISDRFTDYLATGGLFWVLQIVLLLMPGPSLHTLTELASPLGSAVAQLPPAVQTSLAALLGIGGVIVIFFTGMAFDLLQYNAWGEQLWLFETHLQANQVMMDGLATYHAEYLGSSYFRLSEKAAAASSKAQKEKSNKSRITDLWRIERFLISSVVTSASPGGIESLSHAMSLWRMSRATSTMVFFWFFEVGFLLSILGRVTTFLKAILLVAFWIAGPVGGYRFALFLHNRAYARFCDTLFSLAYLTYRRGH